MSRFLLAIALLGPAYALASVGVAIARRRGPMTSPTPVSEAVTSGELHGCFDDLDDLTESLGKHLESFHRLLGGYDQDEAQRWAEEGSRWRSQWRGLGTRCRFPEVRGGRLRKEVEEMAAVHEALGETETRYSQELIWFGKEEAPRLDQIRHQLDVIGQRLDRAPSDKP